MWDERHFAIFRFSEKTTTTNTQRSLYALLFILKVKTIEFTHRHLWLKLCIYIYIISADRAENGKALSAFSLIGANASDVAATKQYNKENVKFSNVYVKKRTNKECKNNSH